jgi:uncharacterized membrane protein YgcG
MEEVVKAPQSHRQILTALLLILLATLTCFGAEVPAPLPKTFVHDFAGVIPADMEAEIQAKAQRLKDEYKTEIAVVTIDSLQGEESFDYSMRMARAWGIGSKETDTRGLLILVAVKDRKTAFRTSRHIEGELPDGVTGEINRQMNGYFKNGDFGGGLSLGMNLILERLKEVYEPQSLASKAPESGFGLGWLWLPVIALPLLGLGYAVSRRSRRRQAELARQGANKSGFRTWAAAKDPSKVPKAKHKSQGITRAGSRSAKGKKRGSERSAGETPNYGYEPSSYSSSSSHDSSSSSYDSGSSSSYDSGSSYSGGSDFGGGGSDSSW